MIHRSPGFHKKVELPTTTEAVSGTTGFSRVGHQLCAIPCQLFHLETPPILVAWSFNFCRLLQSCRVELHATKVGGVFPWMVFELFVKPPQLATAFLMPISWWRYHHHFEAFQLH